jgi:hypothetical protein
VVAGEASERDPIDSGSDQTASDFDQTASDSDQTASGSDQTASEADATQSAVDQAASNREQSIADRDHEGRSLGPEDEASYEQSRAERLLGTIERIHTSQERLRTADERLSRSAERDADAQRRDANAAVRDQAAADRDLAGSLEDAPADVLGDGADELEQLAAARERAEVVRARAAEDRARAAKDRADAAHDRETAREVLRNARAERASQVDQLAGGIAHNFNNLMAIVLGYAERALKQAETTRSQEDLREIIAAADRARALTDQLLEFAGLTSSGRSPVGVNEAIRALAPTLRTLVGSDSTLDLALDPDDPWVAVDSAQFDRIIVNLISNALEAMDGGGAVTLTSASRTVVAQASGGNGLPPGDYVEVSVADSGAGIPSEALGRVMEAFFTTKGPGHTGLGLATVRGVVEGAGGGVEVESEVGVGTSVRIVVPRVGGSGRGGG